MQSFLESSLFPRRLHNREKCAQVGAGGGCEDVMAEVDPTTVTTHVRAYWAKKKKVLDEIVLKDTLGAPLQTPLCEECSAPAIRGAP